MQNSKGFGARTEHPRTPTVAAGTDQAYGRRRLQQTAAALLGQGVAR